MFSLDLDCVWSPKVDGYSSLGGVSQEDNSVPSSDEEVLSLMAWSSSPVGSLEPHVHICNNSWLTFLFFFSLQLYAVPEFFTVRSNQSIVIYYIFPALLTFG